MYAVLPDCCPNLLKRYKKERGNIKSNTRSQTYIVAFLLLQFRFFGGFVLWVQYIVISVEDFLFSFKPHIDVLRCKKPLLNA